MVTIKLQRSIVSKRSALGGRLGPKVSHLDPGERASRSSYAFVLIIVDATVHRPDGTSPHAPVPGDSSTPLRSSPPSVPAVMRS